MLECSGDAPESPWENHLPFSVLTSSLREAQLGAHVSSTPVPALADSLYSQENLQRPHLWEGNPVWG